MEKIHLSLNQIVNFGIAAIIIDLAYFGIGIIPSMTWGGLWLVPSSWTLDYFISPPDAKMTVREISLIILTVGSICLYGWAKSLIDEHV